MIARRMRCATMNESRSFAICMCSVINIFLLSCLQSSEGLAELVNINELITNSTVPLIDYYIIINSQEYPKSTSLKSLLRVIEAKEVCQDRSSRKSWSIPTLWKTDVILFIFNKTSNMNTNQELDGEAKSDKRNKEHTRHVYVKTLS